MTALAYALTSVANVKTYLGISVSTYDALLEDMVDACTEWIEKYIGGRRIFDDAATTEYHDGAELGLTKCSIFLKRWPINSVTGIYYRTGDYDSPTWNVYDAGNDYILNSTTREIYFPGGLPVGVQNIKVVYRGGFTVVPDDISFACKKLVAKEFERRKAQGITTESVGGMSISWYDGLDTSTKEILNGYKNFSF